MCDSYVSLTTPSKYTTLQRRGMFAGSFPVKDHFRHKHKKCWWPASLIVIGLQVYEIYTPMFPHIILLKLGVIWGLYYITVYHILV